MQGVCVLEGWSSGAGLDAFGLLRFFIPFLPAFLHCALTKVYIYVCIQMGIIMDGESRGDFEG